MPKATVQPIQPPPEPDRFAAHAAIFASKLDLKDLDLDERAFLGTCQDLYRNDRGSHTPFENFICTIIRWTTWGNPPKLEDLLDEIKDNFQLDWDLTKHSVKRFIHNYPEFVRELQVVEELLVAAQTTNPATEQPAKAQRTRKPRKKRHAKAAA